MGKEPSVKATALSIAFNVYCCIMGVVIGMVTFQSQDDERLALAERAGFNRAIAINDDMKEMGLGLWCEIVEERLELEPIE